MYPHPKPFSYKAWCIWVRKRNKYIALHEIPIAGGRYRWTGKRVLQVIFLQQQYLDLGVSFFPLIKTKTINNQEPKFLIMGLFCFQHRASRHLEDIATTCSKIMCNTLCLFNSQEDSIISHWGSSKNKWASCFSEERKTQPWFSRRKPSHVSMPPLSPIPWHFWEHN